MRTAVARERGNPFSSSNSGKSELALVAFAYVAYSAARVLVEGSPAIATDHALSVVRVERALGLDWERSAQQWMLARPAGVTFWNHVYQWVYWPTVAIALALLWRIDRVRYMLLRNTVLISAVVGLVIFGLYPVSPPRLLDGYVDTLGVHRDQFIAERSGFVNEYAAIPSFHVGWPAVAGVILAWGSRRFVVWAAALVPTLLLAPAVVFTGNHFVIDILAGLTVAFASLAVANAIPTQPAADEVVAQPPWTTSSTAASPPQKTLHIPR